MKRKVLIFFSILFIGSTLIYGCSNKKIKLEKPKVVQEDIRKKFFDKFIENWVKLDYSSMYLNLADDYKKLVTEKDFEIKMKGMYDIVEAINIKVTPKYPKDIKEDKEGKVHIPFNVTMDTLAGPLSIDNEAIIIKEKHDTKEDLDLIWSDKMIFPQLELDDKIAAKYYIAKRGEILDRNNKILAGNGTGNIRRVYPYKEASAHIVGYVKSISQEDLNILKSKGYSKYDTIGQSGLEKIYETTLKGENGGIIFVKDSKGNKKSTILEKIVKDGEGVKLTIDGDLQNAIYSELQGNSGSAVALQPKTGEVLAMVSSPSYDPNLFVQAQGIPKSKWNEINGNPAKPLINRFAGSYAPGSTFKVITAAIGIKSGTLIPEEGIKISSLQWQPNKSWGNYFVTRVDNILDPINLQKGFIFSDNIYFAQNALKIGKDNFLSESKNLGIGEQIPFDFPLQNSQISSDGNFKNDIQLADSGYGQGQVTMNPLQLALIYGSLVNDGNILKPHIDSKNSATEVWKQNVIPPNACATILSDLTQVVENPSGTAHSAMLPNIKLAGKTGTAEIKQSQSDKTGTENGWFISVNVDNPRLLIAMMIENVKDKGGSHYVVPKVAKIMNQFVR